MMAGLQEALVFNFFQKKIEEIFFIEQSFYKFVTK